MSSKEATRRAMPQGGGAKKKVPSVAAPVRDALAKANLKAEDLKPQDRAERDKLRLVLNKLDAGFWDWDIPTSRVWYSDYVLTLAGYDPEDVTSADTFFKSGVHPDEAPNLGRTIQAVIDGQIDGFRDEFRYRHKEGHWLWFESSGQAVVRSETGLALRIFGQLTCIDDLKKQQADAAFLVDMMDTLHSKSDAAEIEQIAVQRLGEYLAADRVRIGRFDALRRKLIVTQEWKTTQQAPMIGEWQLLRAESALRDSIRTQTDYLSNDVGHDSRITDPESIAFYKAVNCAAFVVIPLFVDGDLSATFVVSQSTPRTWQQREISLIKAVARRLWDTIKRARAEADRAKSQELLRFALRAAKMSARRINMETGEVLLSENLRDMLDDDVADDMTTGAYFSRVHQEDMAQLLSCFEEGQTSDHDGDHRYIAADGSLRHIAAFIRFDQTADGGPQSPRIASTILRNVTQKRQREAEVEQARLQLLKHSRLSAMGVMASTLAHELNQPLTVAANYLALIENGFETRPDHVKMYAQRAAEKVLEAGTTIRSVRNYAADGAVSRRPENLHTMVVTALSAMFEFAEPVKTTIRNAVPEDLAVHVDARMIHHAIANIVRNAVDALGDHPDGRIEISAHRAGEMIDLHIADNGPGMDDNIAVNLFSPFITTKEKGTGLGLPLCRTMVEANGGKISLIRHDARGAVFALTLPGVAPAHPIQEGQEL